MFLKQVNKKRAHHICVLMMAALLLCGTVGMAYADSTPPYQPKINWVDVGYPYNAQPYAAEGDGPWPLALDHFEKNANAQKELVFVNADGKVVLSLKGYDLSDGFSEGLAATGIWPKTDGEKTAWGYLDKKGNMAIPFRYDEAGDFQDGIAAVKVKGVVSYIDKQGNVVSPPADAASVPTLKRKEDDTMTDIWGKIVSDGHLFAYLNDQRMRLTPYVIAMPSAFRDGAATASIGHGYIPAAEGRIIHEFSKFTDGAINEYGDIIIPFVHDYVTSFHDGVAFVRDDYEVPTWPEGSFATRVGIVQLNDASKEDWHTRSVINVEFNGKYVLFDQDPIMENNTVLIPMRALFEAMGATVNWDQKTKEATVAKGNTHITLTVGKKTADVNGKEISMQTPARMEGGRTLIPVRLVAESLGASVSWDAKEKTVVITDPAK